MIFVTVGTHEQQFNRLIEEMDRFQAEHLGENVIIQSGYSTFVPRYAKYKDFFPAQKMSQLMTEARIIITHGGPSTFMEALRFGTIPLVVPRRERFGEHVNDHQFIFSHEVEKIYHNIIVIDDISRLTGVIEDYDQLTATINANDTKHNGQFCAEFAKILKGLVDK